MKKRKEKNCAKNGICNCTEEREMSFKGKGKRLWLVTSDMLKASEILSDTLTKFFS